MLSSLTQRNTARHWVCVSNFKLYDEQVDMLIKSGRDLLRNHPVFQQLLADLKE